MVQRTSSEANWFAAGQEIPRISRNPKVHYRTHKGPPPVSILGQRNPVHIPTSNLLEIHPNIIHPSTPVSPVVSFPPVSPARPYTPPSPQPYVSHAQPISFFSILSPAQYWVRSTNHLAPCYAISSSMLNISQQNDNVQHYRIRHIMKWLCSRGEHCLTQFWCNK